VITKRDLTGAELDVLNMLKGWGRAGNPNVHFTFMTPPSVMFGLIGEKLVEAIPYSQGYRLTDKGWELMS
jgi:hypothetical protein